MGGPDGVKWLCRSLSALGQVLLWRLTAPGTPRDGRRTSGRAALRHSGKKDGTYGTLGQDGAGRRPGGQPQDGCGAMYRYDIRGTAAALAGADRRCRPHARRPVIDAMAQQDTTIPRGRHTRRWASLTRQCWATLRHPATVAGDAER
jgi:hypothetical protein